MKQVKTEYAKCKEKMPHRPPDEIDFGLGFRAALNWQVEQLETEEPFETFLARIKEELE